MVMKPALFFAVLMFSIPLAKAQIYYPLEIGNVWQYKEPPPPSDPYVYPDTVAGDTMMPNGMTYREVRGDISYPPRYYRPSGSKIYEYITYGDSLHRNREILRFDFSKAIGDTVSTFLLSDLDTSVTTVFDVGVINIFGQDRHFVTFYEERNNGAYYKFSRIVDSLGLTFTQWEPGIQFYLSGAIINGVLYGKIVAVKESVPAVSPECILFQNYPNPFNPTTNISFRTVRDGYLSLHVWDLSGRKVRTLFAGHLAAGVHSFVWDGRTDSGVCVASGVYIYRLEGRAFTTSKKMIVVH